LTLLRKDGSEFDGETSANVLHDSSGNPVGLVCVEKDITERRRAEEALRESEGKFRILSDQALMGIIILQDESFVYVNDCAAAIMEVPAERIANWSPGDYAKLIHPDDLAFVMEQGRKKQAGEKDAVIHYDWRMVTPGGNLKWIEMWSKSILFRGRIADMLTMIDITGRKRAEEKLREARDYQEKLIDHANAPVIVWRPDFKITQFNRAFEHLTGYKRAKIINKHLRMLFPEESREVSMKKIDDTLIGESWESVEIPILCKDGTVRLVLWNSSNIYGDDGVTVIATIAQGQDITDAKRAEEALRESEEMARSMLDNAAMGIYLLQDKKFLYVNPTFEKIIGYSSEELVGQEAINYVHPDDRDTVRTKAVENIKGISALPYEFRALRKDGKQIWVMERVASIKYKGRRAVIASFMETTEHRKAEVELERAYEELKTAHEHMVQSEKLRAMGEMASGIAHDFNNMLAVILGRTHLVIDDVKDDKVRKGIQIIEQAALDAAKTVKRLQDFSRIRVEHAFESLDVNQVVGGVLKMLEPRVIELEQTRRIVIKVEEDLREVASVSGDAAELREALLNILFNAIDAMPTGGKLTVKSEQEGDWVEITIKDTGVGMPDKVKSRMFEPFFTTKDAKGSGLGLSVTYGIIARHGGIIKFDSAVGIGTSFYIRLPVAVEEVKKVERQRKAIVAKGAMILAVDDEPEVLRALTLTLEYLGHWAKGFTGGAEAVKAFKDGNYDLVITDLGMPEVSGWDVARAVKDIKPDVAVLLITGWEIELDEEQRTYVDGVISKPFSRDSISSAIARVFPARKRSRRKKSG
ncbi:MAG: PAS domain S-box protein, partial [Chloroflexota bacterium]|nr:PAS domain S-box protein [Chloroflexota bacterium]